MSSLLLHIEYEVPCTTLLLFAWSPCLQCGCFKKCLLCCHCVRISFMSLSHVSHASALLVHLITKEKHINLSTLPIYISVAVARNKTKEFCVIRAARWKQFHVQLFHCDVEFKPVLCTSRTVHSSAMFFSLKYTACPLRNQITFFLYHTSI
jgi:hypothetical protein